MSTYTLKAFDHRVLDLSTQQILEAAERTGSGVAGPIPLPTSIRRFCVIRSPHVDKKSREHFELRVHKRIIDILNPSFTINNKQKISVKAERGNFISDKKILLENNVIFKSSKFKLQTNRAIFNKIDQTATSEESSKFQSEGIVIVSEGFEITENGNIIFFNGKTKLNLDK